jgi:endogenous inhibitor of DNA gyrase (YacG/DUF329 family)
MITLECAWCDGPVTIDSLDATSVECPECAITVDFAPDDTPALPIAA